MAHAPENTALSLTTAEELGVDEIELDVRVSADGIPVISHDDDLSRVLGETSGPSVSATPWSQLERLRLPQGQRLLTLGQVMGLTRADLQIELKVPESVSVVADLFAQHPQQRSRCTLTSFQVPILRELMTVLPDVPRGLIAGAYDDRLIEQARAVRASAILTGWQGLTAAVVEEWHRHGFLVGAWPLRTADDARLAHRLGVDMITADAPGDARGWLDRPGGPSA
jgi:glycerophosphoryl diester phosphodiesterase